MIPSTLAGAIVPFGRGARLTTMSRRFGERSTTRQRRSAKGPQHSPVLGASRRITYITRVRSNLSKLVEARNVRAGPAITEPGMFKRIDHIELLTAAPERTITFYTRVLGFRERERRRIDET